MKDTKGILNRGNLYRLKECMKKAERKEKVTVGFIGGSITQGSLSSSAETCYAYLVYLWFKETFPDTEVLYLNAGIGGTTSQYGAARAREHLLSHEPAFILAEFAVNDDDTDFFRETYEGLVRILYGDEKEPALLLMNNVRFDDGKSAENQHGAVARAYDLPCISMKQAIYSEIEKGRITAEEISPDGLHPDDLGHQLIADAVISFIRQVYEEREIEEEPVLFEGRKLRTAITANGYEGSVLLQNHNSSPELSGFKRDEAEQESIRDLFKKGWTASKEGDKITFHIKGTGIALQYRKSVHKPAPTAEAVVDGDEQHPIMLDGNFLESWGDCLYVETLLEHGKDQEHVIEITITKAHESDAVPFYLTAVIVS